MKRNTFKIRITATVLSVITIFSVMGASAASASAASTGSPIGDAAYAAGIGVIRQYVPGGQAMAGVIDSIVNSFTDKGPSLSDISSDISSMRAEISSQFADIKNQMKDYTEAIENKIVDQTVIANKGTGFDKLMTALKGTDRQIASINTDSSLNDNEKAVEIACLIGRNSEWNKSSNLFFGYQDFMNTLSSPSFADQKDRDLYQVVYNDFTSKVMFSGEALDMSQPYVNRVILLGLYAYSINSQCLKAAQTVSMFTDKEEATLNADEMNNYRSVKSLTSIVNGEINDMNTTMFDLTCKDSVAAHLNTYETMSRTVFLNKGTANKALTGMPAIGDMTKISSDPQGIFNIAERGTLSMDTIKTIVAYVKSAYPGKTLREYLTTVGFDMTAVPKDSYFAVAAAYEYYRSYGWRDNSLKPTCFYKYPSVSVDDSSLNTVDREAFKWMPYDYVEHESLSNAFVVNFKAA